MSCASLSGKRESQSKPSADCRLRILSTARWDARPTGYWRCIIEEQPRRYNDFAAFCSVCSVEPVAQGRKGSGGVFRGTASTLQRWHWLSKHSFDATARYNALQRATASHRDLTGHRGTIHFLFMEQKLKGTPPRLSQIFPLSGWPLYFVTFNTLFRRPLLAHEVIHAEFRNYAGEGMALHAGTGRYVLMPDHLHLFIRIGPDMTLSRWVGGLKQHLGKALRQLGHEPITRPGLKLNSFWQPGFFDHRLRRNESYAQKWEYVGHNPVRAGLVQRPEDWPYQGEIHVIHEV